MSTAVEKDFPVSYKSRPLMTKDSEINKQKIKSTARVTKMNGSVNSCNVHSNSEEQQQQQQLQLNECADAASTSAASTNNDNEVTNNSAPVAAASTTITSTTTTTTTTTTNTTAKNASKNNDSDRENSENHQPPKCNGNASESGDEKGTFAPHVPEQETQQGWKSKSKPKSKSKQQQQQQPKQQADGNSSKKNGDFSGANGTVSIGTEQVRSDDEEKDTSNNGDNRDSNALESNGCPATETTTAVTSSPDNTCAKHINGNEPAHVLENGHVSPSSDTSESSDGKDGDTETVMGGSSETGGNDAGASTSAASQPVAATNGNEQPIRADADVFVPWMGNEVDELAYVNRIVPRLADRFQFYVPQDIVGRLIGKGGANVNEIKAKTNATISVLDEPTTINSKLCVITGSREQIKAAIQLIRNRFKRGYNAFLRYARIDEYLDKLPYDPNYSLRLCKSTINRFRIIHVVNSSHFFFENPCHPMHDCLEELGESMNSHYSFESLDLTRVISGTVCVVFLHGRWLRCMVVSIVQAGVANVKLLDYGGFFIVPMMHLKQIHQSYLALPFQAIEAVMHNIQPPFGLLAWNPETQKEHENLLRRNVELIYRGSGPNHIAAVDMYLPVGELFKLFWNESLVYHRKADWIVPPSLLSTTTTTATIPATIPATSTNNTPTTSTTSTAADH